MILKHIISFCENIKNETGKEVLNIIVHPDIYNSLDRELSENCRNPFEGDGPCYSIKVVFDGYEVEISKRF